MKTGGWHGIVVSITACHQRGQCSNTSCHLPNIFSFFLSFFEWNTIRICKNLEDWNKWVITHQKDLLWRKEKEKATCYEPRYTCWIISYGRFSSRKASGSMKWLELNVERWLEHENGASSQWPYKFGLFTTMFYNVCTHNKRKRELCIGSI